MTVPGVGVATGFTAERVEMGVAATVGAGVGVSVGRGVGVGVWVGGDVGVTVAVTVAVGVNVANSISADETSVGAGVVTVQEDSVNARRSKAAINKCCIDI